MVDFNNICRLCLHEGSVLLPLFKDETLPARIMTLVPKIQIEQRDGLPSRICRDCLSMVNLSYRFRMQCEVVQASLEKYSKGAKMEKIEGAKEINTLKKYSEPSFSREINALKKYSEPSFELRKQPSITMLPGDALTNKVFSVSIRCQNLKNTNMLVKSLVDLMSSSITVPDFFYNEEISIPSITVSLYVPLYNYMFSRAHKRRIPVIDLSLDDEPECENEINVDFSSDGDPKCVPTVDLTEDDRIRHVRAKIKIPRDEDNVCKSVETQTSKRASISVGTQIFEYSVGTQTYKNTYISVGTQGITMVSADTQTSARVCDSIGTQTSRRVCDSRGTQTSNKISSSSKGIQVSMKYTRTVAVQVNRSMLRALSKGLYDKPSEHQVAVRDEDTTCTSVNTEDSTKETRDAAENVAMQALTADNLEMCTQILQTNRKLVTYSINGNITFTKTSDEDENLITSSPKSCLKRQLDVPVTPPKKVRFTEAIKEIDSANENDAVNNIQLPVGPLIKARFLDFEETRTERNMIKDFVEELVHCRQCVKTGSGWDFFEHRREHRAKLVCQNCNLTFDELQSLSDHSLQCQPNVENKANEPTTHCCEKCHRTFPRKWDLTKHKLACHISCEFCSETFTNAYELLKHISQHYPYNDDNTE